MYWPFCDSTNLPNDLLQQLDEIYLYNPASSPTQKNNYLKKVLSLDNAVWFVNPSDPVSSGLYNKMSNAFIQENVYLGDYKFSPLAAHSIGQWSDQIESLGEDAVSENYQNTSREKEKHADESYRAHLHGFAVAQDLAKQQENQDEEVASEWNSSAKSVVRVERNTHTVVEDISLLYSFIKCSPN